MEALGFIETVGLLGAIEAADVMVKAADVRLLERQQAGGGLVTVTVTGEVSAVQAAVEAAVVSLSWIEGVELRSRHVIARPYNELAGIVTTVPAVEPENAEHLAPLCSSAPAPDPNPEMDDPEGAKAETPRFSRAELQKMTVSKLRQLAGSLAGFPLSEQEIKSAVKRKLIEAIAKYSDK